MWFAFGLLLLVGLAVVVWNQAWRMGSIGQSWGKQVVGIHLVNKDTTRPPGGWIGVAKWVVRQVLGNVTCGLYTIVSYLFPLWEQHKRTVDDMIVGTIVVRYPDGRVPV